MDSLPPDPYKALGVAKDADLPAIRSAHRKLVLKCHPDKVQDPELKAAKQDEFQMVQQAYELLSDDKRRLAYDEKVKLFELRKEMGRGASNPRSNPFEYEVRTAEPRTTSTTYTRPAPNVYAQPPPRSYEDVSYDDRRSAPRKTTTSYESERKRTSTREEERERERQRYEDDERARQKMERKAEKTVHSEKKKSRDKERRRGTEEKTRTRKNAAYVDDDSDDDYRDPPPRSFEKKTSNHRMEEEIRMREEAARAAEALAREQAARAQRAREREREREREVPKSIPLDPKWSEHMERAGQYMQAANRKKTEAHIEHPGMRRAETFAAPQQKYNIRYATPTQQVSDDDTPRRSSAKSSARRSSDTPARAESKSRKESKSSRRTPPHPQDPYIVEPPSPNPAVRKPSLQTHSSAPPVLPTYRKEPTRSKTQDYPRTEKTPPLPRASTFTTSGERGREKGSSGLRREIYTSESDSEGPVHARYSHSPPPTRKAPEPTRYIINNGRSVPITTRSSTDHRSDLQDHYTRDRSESPRSRPAERPPMPRQGTERPHATPVRSQSQAYRPPEVPHADPIIYNARPKMSPRENSHRGSPKGGSGGGAYFGEVKYMTPSYGPENIIYAHPSSSHGHGDPYRSGGYATGHREYSYPSSGTRGRETVY